MWCRFWDYLTAEGKKLLCPDAMWVRGALTPGRVAGSEGGILQGLVRFVLDERPLAHCELGDAEGWDTCWQSVQGGIRTMRYLQESDATIGNTEEKGTFPGCV